jgi:hypothetical protein
MSLLDVPLRDCVLRIYDLLVREEFDVLEKLTSGVRLSADELKQATTDFAFRLMPWPHGVDIPMEVGRIEGRDPTAWYVVFPAYTAEEGRSDLSLELTLTRSGDDFDVEFEDLHVL